MLATISQIQQILIFQDLQPLELEQLQPHTCLQQYQQGEIVFHESDRLPAQLYALLSGSLRASKTAATGKETIIRTLSAGEIFAAPALLGDGTAPATITAKSNSKVLTLNRDTLLTVMQQQPEVALRMLVVFNQRLQQLHEIVHGLISERAIVRLARLIQYFAVQFGTEPSQSGSHLKTQLSYYQLARSIGITYEECVRLFKSLKSVVAYSRGGKITVLDAAELAAIASGTNVAVPNQISASKL